MRLRRPSWSPSWPRDRPHGPALPKLMATPFLDPHLHTRVFAALHGLPASPQQVFKEKSPHSRRSTSGVFGLASGPAAPPRPAPMPRPKPQVRYALGKLVGHVTSIAQLKTVPPPARARSLVQPRKSNKTCAASLRVRGVRHRAVRPRRAPRRPSCRSRGGSVTRRSTSTSNGAPSCGRTTSSRRAKSATWCASACPPVHARRRRRRRRRRHSFASSTPRPGLAGPT